MLNWSERYRQKQHYYFDLLHQLIGKHKVKIWSGMFLSVTIIGALALIGLLDPGFDPTDLQHDSSSTALEANPATATPPSSTTVNRPQSKVTVGKWLLVLLASTTGGWLMTYKLKHVGESPKSARPRPKRKGRSKLKPNTTATPRQKTPRSEPLASPQTFARVPRNELSEPTRLPVRRQRAQTPQLNSQTQRPVEFQPAARSRVPARLQPHHSAPVSFPARVALEEPQVSVVPAETIMPLDRREPGLAEMLDLRKRRTIASIMGGMTDVE